MDRWIKEEEGSILDIWCPLTHPDPGDALRRASNEWELRKLAASLFAFSLPFLWPFRSDLSRPGIRWMGWGGVSSFFQVKRWRIREGLPHAMDVGKNWANCSFPTDAEQDVLWLLLQKTAMHHHYNHGGAELENFSLSMNTTTSNTKVSRRINSLGYQAQYSESDMPANSQRKSISFIRCF